MLSFRKNITMSYKQITTIFFFLISLIYFYGGTTNAQPNKGMYSTQPAEHWQEALISGNGIQGIMVFGNPTEERVIFNHEFLYEPLGSADVEPPKIGKYLPKIREMMRNRKYEEALIFSVEMAEKEGYAGLQWTDPYHPALAMEITQKGVGEYCNYKRSVNFESGEINVKWQSKGVKHIRKSFVSRADNVIVHSIQNDEKNVSCSIQLEMQGANRRDWATRQEFPVGHEKSEIEYAKDWLTFRLKYKLTDGGYEVVSKVYCPDGATKVSGNKLEIINAKNVLIISRTEVLSRYNETQIQQTKNELDKLPANYQSLLKKHVEIHSEMFNRMALDIYSDNLPSRSAEELIADQMQLKDSINPELLETMFNMGRYALISSSGNNPPNLMGLWNGQWRPAWSGDFTTDANINLQIASANICNLPEAINSYMLMLERVAPDWEINAKNLYGCRGYLAGPRTSGQRGLHTHFDIPFPGHFWLAGAQWLLLPCFEYYQVSGDKEFLKGLLPMMEKTALFFEDFLTEYDENGKFFIAPSYSPENRPANQKTQASVNATMDIAVAKESFTNLIAVYDELNIKPKKKKQLQELVKKLPPYLINEHDALKEWANPDFEDNNKHRHVSHLYPAWPGHEINPEDTPDLYKAAVKATEMRERGNESAHGLMHMALIGTRLKNPEIVLDNLYFLLINNFLYSSLFTSHNPNLRIYNSDALCSMPAVVTESLVYSRPGFIEFFPAMDKKFPSGSAKNILCRTQAVVKELKWNNQSGEYYIKIKSLVDQKIKIMFRHRNVRISENGKNPQTVEKGSSFQVSFKVGEAKMFKVL